MSDAPTKDSKRRSNPDGKPARRGRAKWIVLAVVLCAGMLAAIWFVRPALRWYQARQAGELVDEVQRLMDEDKFDEAAEKAMEAFEMANRSPKVIRQMVELTSMGQQNLNSCLYFIRRLDELGDLNDEDRRIEADVLARLGRVDEALKEISALIAANPGKAANHATLATVYESQGRTTDAVAALERAVELDPGNLEYVLRLAWDRTKSTFGDVRDSGWTQLWTLAENSDKVGLRALELIAESAEESQGRERLYGREQRLIELLEKHPLAERQHKLTALTWKVRVAPNERESLIDGAADEFATAPPDEQILIVEWLARSGSTKQILEILPPEKAKEKMEFFQAYLNALGLEERWDEIQSTLDASGLPITEGQVHYSLARLLAFSSPGDPRIEAEVARAVQSAGRTGDVVLAMNAARMADSLGLREISDRGYEIAARSREFANEAFGRILGVARMNQEGDRLIEITKLIDGAKHPEPALEEESVYLNLLLGNDVEVYAKRAQDLLTLRPDSARRKLIVALGAHRTADPKAVAEMLAGIDPELLNSGMKAVLTGLFASQGDKDKAAEVSGDVSRALLLPQELAMLESAGVAATATVEPVGQ